MNDFAPKKPVVSVAYQRSALFQGTWMAWGVFGFLFLYADLGSAPLELLILFFYALIVITSVMSFFNRKNEVNHRIQFFNSYMVVPYPMMLWFWQERVIKYQDIKKISFADSLKPGNIAIPFDIHLHLPFERYRILCSKLSEESYVNVFNQLKEFIGFDFANEKTENDLSLIEQKSVGIVRPELNKTWVWRIRCLKFIGFFWCLFTFIASTPYLWLFEGAQFIQYSLIFTLIANIILHWVIPSEGAFASKWQKLFFHSLMGLYLGLGLFQALMLVNGRFDRSPVEIVKARVINKKIEKAGGLFCYQVELPATLSSRSRIPASQANQNTSTNKFEVCNPLGEEWVVGSELNLQVKAGALGKSWLLDVNSSK